ncbi:hypothetical protein XELAEV_18016508mg [Xenopus laevis]|uniref:B30.2/SPRY domain-containing protein n=1 Tax=Xenopus laevis TaxID=8355 RepID=A0A974HX48_XENLA|nr:hypothetical protein XELAEV_18016508mg [Xenopus laevis]
MRSSALQRNRTLGNIAERFLCAQPESDLTGIFCTYCIHSLVPAAKSCLLCEASQCESHNQVQSRSADHVLTTPATLRRGNVPSIKSPSSITATWIPCVSVRRICPSCCLACQHKCHRVELLSNVSEKKKEKLRKVLLNLPLMIEEAENKRLVTQSESSHYLHLEVLEQRVLREFTRQEEDLSLQVFLLIQQLEGVYGKGATHILLDIDTASKNMDQRTASWTSANQLRPQTPSRFMSFRVLSANSITSGQYFWDMEVSESGSWRAGGLSQYQEEKNQFWIGNNIKSWCLWR